MMRRERFEIASIYVPVKRRSTLNPDVVQQIAQSMLESGQETPILVRRDGDRLVLVHDLHRLEACKVAPPGRPVLSQPDGDARRSIFASPCEPEWAYAPHRAIFERSSQLARAGLLVVRLSDDCRLVILRLVVAVFAIVRVIIVVRVPRWHHPSRVGQPNGSALGDVCSHDVCSHIGSCWASAQAR
jgi:sulfiredoxin